MAAKVIPARALMPKNLTPAQRAAYDELRTLTRMTLARYADVGPGQRVLAESAGVTQSLVSRVLLGQVISHATLEGIARLVMTHVVGDERQQLRAALARMVDSMRDHHDRPPRPRPPK
jgi:transcriptional regulator with XRE-family HTH domain